MLAVLVVISLLLLTDYFGESASSPLHRVQRGIVAVLSPIQSGASTVFSPVSDVANWVSTTLHAKTQRDQLKRQLQAADQQLAKYKTQAIQNAYLSKQLGLAQSVGLKRYDPVAANVISRDPSLWYQTIEVNAGSGDGVVVNDPVTGDGGLVGKVTEVTGSSSIVTLITNASSNAQFGVTATVTNSTGDTGVLEPAVGNPNQMVLQDLPNRAQIRPGMQVVTAGYKDPSNAQLDSLYPPGILIGTVASFNPNELLNSGQVPVTPTANVRAFTSVQILTKVGSGNERAQVTP
ncbi:MAG: rod shape-determining protein MreC [Solirubrobacteraceae bacterium]